MKWSTAKRRINKTLDELFKSVADEWYANYRNGYVEGYIDARQGIAPKYAEAYTTDRKTEPLDKDINVRSKTEPQIDCLTCRYNSDEWDSPKCDGCSKADSHYEPQTDCSWK